MVDYVRAAAGSSEAKDHLGVLPKTKYLIYAGPSEFKARFNGKKGWLNITQGQNKALVFRRTRDPQPQCRLEEDPTELSFRIRVDDISQLRRVSAFASASANKGINWITDSDLLGSLEVVDHDGKTG